MESTKHAIPERTRRTTLLRGDQFVQRVVVSDARDELGADLRVVRVDRVCTRGGVRWVRWVEVGGGGGGGGVGMLEKRDDTNQC